MNTKYDRGWQDGFPDGRIGPHKIPLFSMGHASMKFQDL